jgi:stage V sporulation protein AC
VKNLTFSDKRTLFIKLTSAGFVLGVGANMFKIVGPVIVYGTLASVIYGVIYWVATLF